MPYSRTEVGHGVEPEDEDYEEEEPTLEELQAEVERPNQKYFDPSDQRAEFTHTQLVAFINDWKQNRKGDVIVTMTVPYRYRRFAAPLIDAQGMPLSVDIIRWHRFEQYRKSLAGDTPSRGIDA